VTAEGLAAALRIDGLTKHYGAVVAVEQLSLEVEAGSVFGFLGANGAGKTTTIRMLLDLLRPTSGAASILGFDCRRQSHEVRRRVGFLPSEMPFYPDQSGAGYLKFVSALGPRRPSPARLAFLLKRFDLSDRDLRRRMRDYSHGMKRKVGLIQALMTEPPVLILDEPTSGLDPLMIEAFCETIDELARGGRTTVFLSSHVLAEVDRVCERIALIRSGRLVAVKTMRELRLATPRRVTVLFSTPVDAAALPPGLTLVAGEPRQWVIDAAGPIGELIAMLAHLPVADVTVAPFTPTDTILRMFGEDAPC
jgi:ABC-2 type transport system ATP-binding protein